MGVISYVSNSEIQVFKQCRRRWWLKHVRSLAPRRDSLSRAREVGSLVHNGLEAYYQAGMVKTAGVAAIVKDAWEMRTEWGESDEVEWIIETATRMIDGYMEWVEDNGLDANLTVLESEKIVTYPILGSIHLIGTLDLRVRDEQTGRIGLMEHKTVNNFSDRLNQIDIDEQLKMYHALELASRDAKNDDENSFVLLNLLRRVKRTVRAKPPFYHRERVTHTRAVLRHFWEQKAVEIEEMERVRRNEALAFPSPGKSCAWLCEFREVCPMMDDIDMDHEKFLIENFQESDPMARYEKYIEKAT